jgi:hypothetical protein
MNKSSWSGLAITLLASALIFSLAYLFVKMARIKELSDALADVGYDISYTLEALNNKDYDKCHEALEDSIELIRTRGTEANSVEQGRLKRFMENERLRGWKK